MKTYIIPFFLIVSTVLGQYTEVEIPWRAKSNLLLLSEEGYEFECENSQFHESTEHQIFIAFVELEGAQDIFGVFEHSAQTVPFSEREQKHLQTKRIGDTISFQTRMVDHKTRVYLEIPILRSEGRLISSQLQILSSPQIEGTRQKSAAISTSATLSNLSSGSILKIGTQTPGVYRVSGENILTAIGSSSIALDDIAMYGYHNAEVPAENSAFRYNDVPEIAIETQDNNGNGVLDPDDGVLFVSNGVIAFEYLNNQSYGYKKSPYDNTAYYFLKVESGSQGKRIAPENAPSVTQSTLTTFDHLYSFEEDKNNIAGVGRVWYGERINSASTPLSLNFASNPPANISPNTQVKITGVSRASSTSSLVIKENTTEKHTASILPLTNPDLEGRLFSIDFENDFIAQDVQISLDYQSNSGVNTILMDYISIARKEQIGYFGDMHFMRFPGIQSTASLEFQSVTSSTKVWNVSDPVNITSVEIQGNNTANVLLEEQAALLVFEAKDALSPISIEPIENQNLHGLQDSSLNYIVIYHPEFENAANRLVEYRASEYNATAVNVFDIYNEFSSGSKDISAIRDFIKTLYNTTDNLSSDEALLHVVLFGDASIDFQSIRGELTDFVPTWESIDHLSVSGSDASDDFYTFLDNDEGGDNLSGLDDAEIAIGRINCYTSEEAEIMVDKIQHYESSNSLGSWQNRVTMVTDDVDQAWERGLTAVPNILMDDLQDEQPQIRTEKLFADAFQQFNTSAGERYPRLEQEIDAAVNLGSTIVHYYGHGGETGWSSERILNLSRIRNYSNLDNMPFFITATCEFTRYDDPLRISAGEYLYLNPTGGAIGLLTSTRTLTIADARNISQAFYDAIQPEDDGRYPTVGRMVREMKNNLFIGNKSRMITLGDPALRLKFPRQPMRITQLSNSSTSSDTISSLSLISLSGEVQRLDGSRDTDFQGEASIAVYDKQALRSTLNNDGIPVSPVLFKTYSNLIYSGTAEVENGSFNAEFFVPQDIQINLGKGKVFLYAKSSSSTGWGSDTSIVIGGVNPDAVADNTGPDIDLFMGSEFFVNNGIVARDAPLLAFLEDEHGINTVGSGIGHDLIAVLDDNFSEPIILNNFYNSVSGNFREGEVYYPFSDLQEGSHTLTLRAWDNYNNSNSKTIQFRVSDSPEFEISPLNTIPNPMVDITDFQFSHNFTESQVQAELNIYDVFGRRVKQFSALLAPNQNNVKGLFVWQGESDSGAPVAEGTYFGRLYLKDTSSGSIAIQSTKIIRL